jgi:hypothetical protein
MKEFRFNMFTLSPAGRGRGEGDEVGFDGFSKDYRITIKEYRPAKKCISVSVGESVRILRELQELSQNQLSALTGIPSPSFRPLKKIASVSALSGQRFLREH